MSTAPATLRPWQFAIGLALLMTSLFALPVRATCPEEPALQNYTGGGQSICPCFVAGEEAGAVLTAPAGNYPIEILRVGIGWASQFGGNPQQQEAAVNIYGAGLPNPGAPVFSLPGPLLSDGFINEFNLDPLPGEIVINSGSFTVTLEFLNDNAGDTFAPSMVHDGNGCQGGKNVVYAIPGGWLNACALGVTGDWVVYAVYRKVNCTTSADEQVIASRALWPAQPNPFSGTTRLTFVAPGESALDLAVYDVAGRRIATLASGSMRAGIHTATWNGKDENGRQMPAGNYFARLEAGSTRETQRILLIR